MPLLSAIRSAARAASGLVYPRLCLGCGQPLATDAPVCASCLRRLPGPSPEAVREHLLARDASPPLARRAVVLWRFDVGGAVQRVQHALKYGKRPSVGRPLGRVLGEKFARSIPGWTPQGVAPVPLARLRELERGYNQSDGLASGVAEAFGIEATRLLIRSRATQSQTTLAYDQRHANVDGAFGLAPEVRPVAGRRILIVDDVMTTGATLLAAAQPLIQAGAEVGVCALAMPD